MIGGRIVPATHTAVMGDRLSTTITTSGTTVILMEAVGVLRHIPERVAAVVCILIGKETLHLVHKMLSI